MCEQLLRRIQRILEKTPYSFPEFEVKALIQEEAAIWGSGFYARHMIIHAVVARLVPKPSYGRDGTI